MSTLITSVSLLYVATAEVPLLIFLLKPTWMLQYTTRTTRRKRSKHQMAAMAHRYPSYSLPKFDE